MNERSSLISYKLFYGMLEVDVYCTVSGNFGNEFVWNSGFDFRVDFLANGNKVSSYLTFGKNLLARILITLLELFNFTVSNGYYSFNAVNQSLYGQKVLSMYAVVLIN